MFIHTQNDGVVFGRSAILHLCLFFRCLVFQYQRNCRSTVIMWVHYCLFLPLQNTLFVVDWEAQIKSKRKRDTFAANNGEVKPSWLYICPFLVWLLVVQDLVLRGELKMLWTQFFSSNNWVGNLHPPNHDSRNISKLNYRWTTSVHAYWGELTHIWD